MRIIFISATILFFMALVAELFGMGKIAEFIGNGVFILFAGGIVLFIKENTDSDR